MRIVRALRGVVFVPCTIGVISLLLAFAGCGSASKTASTTSTNSSAASTTTTSGSSQSIKSASYNISLSHVAGSSGVANASGVVILSVRTPSDELCWNISPVKNFTISTSKTQATIVTIQPTPSGTPSTPGVPLGFAYKASGCVHVPSAFLERLEAHPQTYYLSIYNTQSGDAVRAQV